MKNIVYYYPGGGIEVGSNGGAGKPVGTLKLLVFNF